MTSTVRVEVAGVSLEVYGREVGSYFTELDIRSKDNLIPLLREIAKDNSWIGYDKLVDEINRQYWEDV